VQDNPALLGLKPGRAVCRRPGKLN
jgi:hypothetical protein